jgi:hypothetical protein
VRFANCGIDVREDLSNILRRLTHRSRLPGRRRPVMPLAAR